MYEKGLERDIPETRTSPLCTSGTSHHSHCNEVAMLQIMCLYINVPSPAPSIVSCVSFLVNTTAAWSSFSLHLSTSVP